MVRSSCMFGIALNLWPLLHGGTPPCPRPVVRRSNRNLHCGRIRPNCTARRRVCKTRPRIRNRKAKRFRASPARISVSHSNAHAQHKPRRVNGRYAATLAKPPLRLSYVTTDRLRVQRCCRGPVPRTPTAHDGRRDTDASRRAPVAFSFKQVLRHRTPDPRMRHLTNHRESWSFRVELPGFDHLCPLRRERAAENTG